MVDESDAEGVGDGVLDALLPGDGVLDRDGSREGVGDAVGV